MSGNGVGDVSVIQNGNGKIHVTADYTARPKLSDVDSTRCGKLDVMSWKKLPDMHYLGFMDHPNACATCVRQLGND